jgi:hypothetical protein
MANDTSYAEEWTGRVAAINPTLFITREPSGLYYLWQLFNPTVSVSQVLQWTFENKQKVATIKTEASLYELPAYLLEARMRTFAIKTVYLMMEKARKLKKEGKEKDMYAEMLAYNEYLAPAVMKWLEGRPVNVPDVMDGFNATFGTRGNN